LHDGPLAAYLAAEHALRCEGDAANAGVLVPSGVRTMDGPLRRLRARVAFARGDVDRAITLLAPAIAEGSLADLSLLAEPNATVPPDVALSLLQSAAAARPASTPADLHADLAQIAMAVGDLETARVHALGAAASGSSRTSELLTFLAGRTEAGAEAAQLAGWAAAAAPGAPDGVVHVDINTRLAEWTRDRTGFVDSKQDLVVGERATVHLHALGAGQTTPLHIHDAGDEVTLILSGRPDVSHVVPDGGALRTVERPASAMTLLWTGRSTGHQWSNAASPAPQGNLVFSFPAFQGNRYMPRWDDPRLHEGSAPADWTPAASIEEFASGARDLELLRVPLPQDGFHLLLLRGGTELPALPSPLVLYVFQGTGRLSLPGAPLPLGPSTFTYLPSAAAAGGRVEADGELAILIVALGR
jgi:hypothetical protein